MIIDDRVCRHSCNNFLCYGIGNLGRMCLNFLMPTQQLAMQHISSDSIGAHP